MQMNHNMIKMINIWFMINEHIISFESSIN
jgi:hypothetical protein